MRHQRKIPLAPIVKELRRDGTYAEYLLWQELRRHGLCGFKVRRQHQIENYVVDFFCPALHLIIEVDGGIHNDPNQRAYDERRSLDLASMGFKILRFSNEHVKVNLDGVMSRLRQHAEYVLIARQGVR